MRATFVPALAAVLLAAPAFAAQSGSDMSATKPAQSQAKADSGQAAGSQQQQWHAMTPSQLRSQLEQAGFKNIRIIDATYAVQAQGPAGDQVMLFINPPEVAGQASNAAGSDMTGQGTPDQSTTGKTMPGQKQPSGQ